MNRFEAKRVVVASGGSGIGAATAERLAREGARLVVGDINEDGARATVERIVAAGGIAEAIRYDLADEASTNALMARCVDAYGGIDGLLNVGADLSHETMAGDLDVLEMSVDVWQRTLRVNVIGHALTCREAIRQMVKQGTGGAIVCVSSEAASCGEDTRPAYAASKAAVNALMPDCAALGEGRHPRQLRRAGHHHERHRRRADADRVQAAMVGPDDNEAVRASCRSCRHDRALAVR